MTNDTSSDPYWSSLLKGNYKVLDFETTVMKESMEEGTSNDMFAKFICDAMNKRNFQTNLSKLYNEAVYGKDLAVRKRVITRIYTIRAKIT